MTRRQAIATSIGALLCSGFAAAGQADCPSPVLAPRDFTGWRMYDHWDDTKFTLESDGDNYTLTEVYQFLIKDGCPMRNPAWMTATYRLCFGIDPEGRGWRVFYRENDLIPKVRPWYELTLEMIRESADKHADAPNLIGPHSTPKGSS